MNIEDKISKLLKLAESSNTNEASAAAERAAELLEKYQIDRSQLPTQDEESDPFVSDWIFIHFDHNKRLLRKVPDWAHALGAAAQYLFDVRALVISPSVKTGELESGHIMAWGRRSHVLAARLALTTYAQAINVEVRANPEIKGKSAFQSFRLAAAREIARRAREWKDERTIRERKNEEYGALVRADRNRAEAMMRADYPETNPAPQARLNDWAAANAGSSFGRKVSLGRDAALPGRKLIG